MANLPESATWETGIYQLEEADLVQGGANGIDNMQGKQLANRTAYLKAQVESLGAGKQPLDATLTALAALSGVADRLAYFIGPDAFALTPLSAFIRTLLDDADAATARGTLGAAPLDSPALTGTPTAPTALAGTSTTQLATTAFVQAAIAALVNASPTTLDTLNELAAALGNDANFSTTITNALALKASINSVQNSASIVSAAGGTADAITGSYTPGITALTNGMTLYVRAASANATTTPTFTPNSGTIAAKTIVKGNGQALVAGDIAGGGHWIELQYDSTLDKWVLLNPTNSINAFGSGQTWQNMLGSRAASTTYTNSTGKPIIVAVSGTATSSNGGFNNLINSTIYGNNWTVANGSRCGASYVIPPGSTYGIVTTSFTIDAWFEYRT